jgi:Tol biopolymer transport system component
VTPSTFLAVPISTSGLTLTAQGLALSPDGQTTAFVAARPGDTPRLFVRRLADNEPRVLEGTEGGEKPFFSPDGQQIAFGRRGLIERVALRGGAPQPVISDPDWTAGEIQFGGVWTADNRVIFGGGYLRPGIWQVPAEGGLPEELVRGEQSSFYNFPDALPDDKGVVFTVYRGGRSGVSAWSRTNAVREVIKNASRARYLATGHLLYEEGGSLRIVRFNCDTLRTEGDARIVVENVGTAWVTSTWDASATGTLVYTPPYVGHRRLVWRDRHGNATPLPLKERPYISLSLSPDNTLLVVGVGDALRRQLWRGSPDAEPLQPFTYGLDDLYHAFSADGRWVAFTRHEKGRYNVWRTPTDGSGTPEPLTSGDRPEGLPAFSPDGNVLLFNTPEPTGDFHVWLKRLDPPGEPRPFIFTPSVHAEAHAAFSPDGRWVAYMSDAAGHGNDVWVKPYPDGQSIQVSTDGGWNPVWNPGGQELFYQGAGSLMSVRFASGRPGRPAALFPSQPAPGGIPVYQYAVSRDGRRFLMFDSVESATQPSLIYVLSNWLEPLTAKLPPQR